MPSLQVREVPDVIYASLADQARQNHRSLAQQTLAYIEEGLGVEGSGQARRRRLVSAIFEAEASEGGELPGPADLLRQDRDR